MVPETYQMLQSDNAFDDVEIQDPLFVFSSSYYNLRHQLCKKHQEEAVMEKNQNSSAKDSTFIVCKDTQPAFVCEDIQPDIVCEDIQPDIECQEVVCEDSQPAIECQESLKQLGMTKKNCIMS